MTLSQQSVNSLIAPLAGMEIQSNGKCSERNWSILELLVWLSTDSDEEDDGYGADIEEEKGSEILTNWQGVWELWEFED